MTVPDTPTPEDAVPNEFSRDDLFHLLSNHRRRAALRYLHGRDEPVDMRDLAERIAALEHDKPVAQLHSKERQRVYIALYQTHLPKLDECGVIEYNQSRGIVRRTPLADRLDPYPDLEPSGNADGGEPTVDTPDRPRRPPTGSTLGVVAVGIATLAVSWAGLLPPLLLLTLTWVALFAALWRPRSTGLMDGTPLIGQ